MRDDSSIEHHHLIPIPWASSVLLQESVEERVCCTWSCSLRRRGWRWVPTRRVRGSRFPGHFSRRRVRVRRVESRRSRGRSLQFCWEDYDDQLLSRSAIRTVAGPTDVPFSPFGREGDHVVSGGHSLVCRWECTLLELRPVYLKDTVLPSGVLENYKYQTLSLSCQVESANNFKPKHETKWESR